jgi:1,4-dihydroxy-2-naphthoate octaprenyltransferase
MDVVVLSLDSGLAIDTLLMVNNYRDREQDAVSGKCTLVVRYGKKFGENMYLALGIAAVLLCFWFVYTGKLTPLEFIWAPCVYLYMHALTWRKMIQIGSGKKLNSILGETSRNMLFLGLLLAVALN